jgi:single-stranded DNA-binding protein
MKKILILIFLSISFIKNYASIGDDYFHNAALQYVDGKIKEAKQTVQEGLQIEPQNPNLNALAKKLDEEQEEQKQQQSQDDKKNEEEQDKDEQQKQQQKQDQQDKDKEKEEQQQQMSEEEKQKIDNAEQILRALQQKERELMKDEKKNSDAQKTGKYW